MAHPLITIRWDLDPLITYFSDQVYRQVPFATSVALNDVAFKARKALADDLDDRFTSRNTWTVKGLRVNKSHKTRLIAEVGTLREYMVKHVEGGKRPGKQKLQAVPLEVRTPETKALGAKSTWPGSMLRKKRSRLVPLSRGRALVLTKRSKKAPYVAQWILVPQVTIRQDWPLGDIVRDVVKRYWQEAMRRAWEKAMKPPSNLRKR